MSYEKPAVSKIEAREDYVFQKFESVGFNIGEFPELYERLVELASMPESHFEDAVSMAEIVNLIWNDLNFDKSLNFSKEEIKTACLFHDVGKSGPADADRKQRMMIEQIFNPIYFNVKTNLFKNSSKFKDKSEQERKKMIKDMTIAQVLEIQNFSNINEIKQYLSTLKLHIFNEKENKIETENLDLNKHNMIQLWREHDYWTMEILEKYGRGKISNDLIIVASSHHTLEGHDPAMVDGNIPNEAVALETIDKYLILTLIDKYQAFIDRENISHDQTIKILKNMAKDSRDKGIINHHDRVYNLFIKYITILEKHPEIANQIKK